MHNRGLDSKLISHVSLDGLGDAAEQIISFAGDMSVWTFNGEMGAGKTTLIKEICDRYDVIDNVSSPTFSIINEYINNNNDYFYHFDFYRIEKEQEAMDIGCDEYFYSGNHCFIEWPSKIPNLIPDQFLQVEILIENESLRTIKLLKNV